MGRYLFVWVMLVFTLTSVDARASNAHKKTRDLKSYGLLALAQPESSASAAKSHSVKHKTHLKKKYARAKTTVPARRHFRVVKLAPDHISAANLYAYSPRNSSNRLR